MTWRKRPCGSFSGTSQKRLRQGCNRGAGSRCPTLLLAIFWSRYGSAQFPVYTAAANASAGTSFAAHATFAVGTVIRRQGLATLQCVTLVIRPIAQITLLRRLARSPRFTQTSCLVFGSSASETIGALLLITVDGPGRLGFARSKAWRADKHRADSEYKADAAGFQISIGVFHGFGSLDKKTQCNAIFQHCLCAARPISAQR